MAKDLTLEKIYQFCCEKISFCRNSAYHRTTFLKDFFCGAEPFKTYLDEDAIKTVAAKIVKGACFSAGDKKTGMKNRALYITERLSGDGKLLADYFTYFTAFMQELSYDTDILHNFINEIIEGNYTMPKALKKNLHTMTAEISEENDIRAFAWICILALIGPSNINALSLFWNHKSAVTKYIVNKIEGDQVDFIMEYPPDGGIFTMGSRIFHSWIIRNTGTVPWRGRYLTCINSSTLGFSIPDVPIPDTLPGEDAVLTVKFDCMPFDVGIFRLTWKMIHGDGSLAFGDYFPGGIGLNFTVSSNIPVLDSPQEIFLGEDLEKYASCGKEDSIVFLDEKDGCRTVLLDFNKRLIRDEIPDWAGVGYIFKPVKTYSDISISFDACCPDECLSTLQIELHSFPANAALPIRKRVSLSCGWKHYKLHFSYSDDLHNISELRFITKVTFFTDERNIKGAYLIKNIVFQGVL